MQAHLLITLGPSLHLSTPSASPASSALALGSRREVEAYLERLNRASPVALRQIARWSSAGGDSLHVRAVPMPERYAELGAFMGESSNSFALSIEARQAPPAQLPYSVGLLLKGAMRVHGSDGEQVVQAGQGVIVNPAETERTWLEADTQLLEFMLPKSLLVNLGAELSPGNLNSAPRFQPLLSNALARRLQFMACEAARSLDGPGPEGDWRFRRWLEMIGMTLLHEQPVLNAVKTRAVQAEPPPAALRRALDFIEAHAADDILLADIAAAASLSVSSLGRLFVRHLDCSPAAMLRNLRLDRIREELRRGDAGTIRDLALRWGFQSASQFSQAYRRRFGESPRDARNGG